MTRIVRMSMLMLWIAWGCARPPAHLQPPVPLDVLAENIEWARENVAILEQLPLPETSQDDFQRAAHNLNLAERTFAQGLYDEAYLSALESLSISQKLVRQLYADEIASPARVTKAQIETIIAEDPESPLQEFLPVLTEILDYAEGIETTSQKLDMRRVQADFEQIAQIAQDAQNSIQHTLESDISFESGEYRLSAKGQEAVVSYCEELLRIQRSVAAMSPERNVLMRINVVGYTDQVDFKENTKLLQLLTTDIDPQTIPQGDPELRKFLNQRLSEFRAATIGDAIRQHMQSRELPCELHSLGLGEELPPGIPPSDIFPDPRRRICKIYTYILLQSDEE